MHRVLLAAATALAMSAALAAFPDEPVTLVVPFSAGGPTDKVARDLGAALALALKQTVIIENVGGAGGTLGATKVAKAAADGHTLLLYHIGMATAPALYRNLPFKPLADFEFLGMVNEVPMALIGSPTLPAHSFPELLKWLRAHQREVKLANAGLGAASHLCGLLLQQSLQLPMTTVAYKGTGPAMTDLLGGHVDLMCDQTTNAAAQIDSGRVQAYAVTTLKPLVAPGLSRLPTLDSLGQQGFNVSVWHGLYAPRGTPAHVVETLNAALRASLKNADFIRKQQALGAVIVDDARQTPGGHRRFVEAEIARWGPTLRSAGQFAD